MYTRDILSTQQSFQLKSENTAYTSKIGEKEFSDVWEGCMSKDFEIKVQFGWFVGLAHSLYFTPLSLHVSSPSQN